MCTAQFWVDCAVRTVGCQLESSANQLLEIRVFPRIATGVPRFRATLV